MPRHPHPLLLLLALLPALVTTAQDYSYGIDPARDSAAFARFRTHMDSIRRQRPTVAVVLSGGGAKGAAHVPILQLIDSTHVPVDLIMGTSIGGLIGGLYAVGYSGDDLERLIRTMRWESLMRDFNPRRYNALQQKDHDRQYQIITSFGSYMLDLREAGPVAATRSRTLLGDGIIQGRNVENLFASLLTGYEDPRDFLALPTPFACIATDMISAKPKIWHSGSLISALRSTMAIPGLFSPVKQDGMVLLDGSMRSNMPAEVARQMGADIIIAVDISSPALEATQMNSLIDIVYQATDVMAREAYDAALQTADIYIRPDISGFGLLSFDAASIDSLLSRGRQAAETHRSELESLAQRLSATQRDSERTRAIDLQHTPIVIDTIIFSGVNPKEEAYIRDEISIKNVVTKHLLDRAVARLIGTRAFEKVTYTLLGEQMPYTLRFDCQRAPVNQAAIGGRFDSRDYAALQLYCGLGANRLTGRRIDLTARLGLKTSLSVAYAYRTPSGFKPGIELSFQSVRNGDFRANDYNFRFEFNRSRADLYIDLSPWRMFDLRIGAQADYFYWTTLLADFTLMGQGLQVLEKSNIYTSLYTRMRIDSYDNPFFPTQGSRVKLTYNFYPHALLHETTPFHAVQLALQTVLTTGHLTFQPIFHARYVSADVVPYTNALTINPANAFLDQQIPFVGTNNATACQRTLGTIGLNLRTRLARKHHLTASVQAIHQSQQLRDYFDADASRSNIGVALEYAYHSVIGPLRASVHWSDFDHSLGAYIALGLEF